MRFLAPSPFPRFPAPPDPYFEPFAAQDIFLAMRESREKVTQQIYARNALLSHMMAEGKLGSPADLRICACGMAVPLETPECAMGCFYTSD